ncbi:hypothetical protein [[Mycoplasma] anseris]|uniref:Uncharacterized protein n=1 Tax=[Mycoplasma] anseris TaxID=92400 RepID=A0A2Z4NCL3_9BACT|nr:hypothetical protein [[Mycoplasma] anseris]AWX69304.1 hypothetical protein DP065_00845 [[Mycoplasma] anseris]
MFKKLPNYKITLEGLKHISPFQDGTYSKKILYIKTKNFLEIDNYELTINSSMTLEELNLIILNSFELMNNEILSWFTFEYQSSIDEVFKLYFLPESIKMDVPYFKSLISNFRSADTSLYSVWNNIKALDNDNALSASKPILKFNIVLKNGVLLGFNVKLKETKEEKFAFSDFSIKCNGDFVFDLKSEDIKKIEEPFVNSKKKTNLNLNKVIDKKLQIKPVANKIKAMEIINKIEQLKAKNNSIFPENNEDISIEIGAESKDIEMGDMVFFVGLKLLDEYQAEFNEKHSIRKPFDYEEELPEFAPGMPSLEDMVEELYESAKMMGVEDDNIVEYFLNSYNQFKEINLGWQSADPEATKFYEDLIISKLKTLMDAKNKDRAKKLKTPKKVVEDKKEDKSDLKDLDIN